MKRLSEILRTAFEFYVHINPTGRDHYMCHALGSAQRAGKITLEELQQGQALCRELVRSINPTNISLGGALLSLGNWEGYSDLNGVCAMIFQAVADKLEEEEAAEAAKMEGVKYRHLRNEDYTPAHGFIPHNLGGITLAYKHRDDGLLEVGVAVCSDNFCRKEGRKHAVKRLLANPLVIEAGLLVCQDVEELLYYPRLVKAVEKHFNVKLNRGRFLSK